MSRRKDGLIVNDGLWREYADSSTDCSACSARQEAMVHGVIARSGIRVFFSKEKMRVMEMSDTAECCCSGTAITGSIQMYQDSQYHSMTATETPC